MNASDKPARAIEGIALVKPDVSSAAEVARKRPVGRPSRYAKFEAFEASLASPMRRVAYCDSIGIYKGAREATVFVKLTLPHGGMYRGRSIKPGGAVEHKLGKRASFDWQQLIAERDRLQGLADRDEPLEPVEVDTFAKYALDWLERRKPTLRSYGVTKGNVNSALIPTFGKKALNAITVADVNRWIWKQSVSVNRRRTETPYRRRRMTPL